MATEYIKGLYAKKPSDKAPKYVIANLSANREELIAYLQGKEGKYVNMVIKDGQKGYYVSFDAWKPTRAKSDVEIISEDVNW